MDNLYIITTKSADNISRGERLMAASTRSQQEQLCFSVLSNFNYFIGVRVCLCVPVHMVHACVQMNVRALSCGKVSGDWDSLGDVCLNCFPIFGARFFKGIFIFFFKV